MSGAVRSVKKAVSGVGKTVRKIIPNEISSIAVKAAPFVAPFNPLLAGGMAALGSYDQTGSFGRALKAGLFTYGGGQLGRFIGGAGIQRGINPFAGYNPAASFGGLGSLFSSPIGTTSGLRLGQYKLFGGTPTQQLLSDTGGVPTESIFTQPGAPGTTYLPSDFATEALPLEPGSITSGGQIVSGTAAQNQAILNQIAKQSMPGITSATTATTGGVTPGYKDLFTQVLRGDLSQKTEAIKQLGGKALKDIYTKPIPGEPGKTQIDKLAIGATIAGATSYMEAKKLAEEAELVDDADEYTEEMYNADKQRYTDYYSKILTPEAFGIKNYAMGGRVGFAYGTEPEGVLSITLTEQNGRDNFEKGSKPILSINPMQDDLSKIGGLDEELEGPAGLGALGLMQLMKRGAPTFTSAEKTLVIKNLAGRAKGKPEYKELGMSIPEARKIMDNPDKYLKDATILKEFVNVLMGKKDGGRIGYAMGSEVPVRQNQAGVNEMDFRDTGGFVPPIGVKERADDIPAMLSNNEFVFTADAVRAAGGGSVNKGAQKMYALMKQLEGKMA